MKLMAAGMLSGMAFLLSVPAGQEGPDPAKKPPPDDIDQGGVGNDQRDPGDQPET